MKEVRLLKTSQKMMPRKKMVMEIKKTEKEMELLEVAKEVHPLLERHN